MAPSFTKLTELTLSEARRKWGASAFGSCFIGSGLDRPVRVTAGKLMYCGIKDPLYGAGFGQSSNTATLLATTAAVNIRAVGVIATIDGGGGITSVTVAIKGTGYAAAPTGAMTVVTAATISADSPTASAGSLAEFTATLTSTRVTSIAVDVAGSGYSVGEYVILTAPPAGNGVLYPQYGTDFFLAAPTGTSMISNITVKEVFYRELTHERSLAGTATGTLALGSGGTAINLVSNAVAASTEKYVSHREFYVAFTDLIGAYYYIGRVPYTAAADGDDFSTAASTISKNRPLEDLRQTALYPAVRTATFWRSRIWGGHLEPRTFEAGSTIDFVNGSELCTLTGDTWEESDVYKGIVNTTTNEIVAYVDRIVTTTVARIRLPNNTIESNAWTGTTQQLTAVSLTGDESMVFASPIYAGEAGGGITYGMLTFNALDSLRDEALYASGARIGALVRSGESLAIIYDRGIAFLQGEVSVESPPRVRSYLAAENVGTFNPDSVWHTPNGDLYFQGNQRIYRVSSGQITDATAAMGCANLWTKKIAANMFTQNLFQVTYNPTHNRTIMVGLPKSGEAASALGTYSLVISHDKNEVGGARWPVSFQCARTIRHDDGIWQTYGGAGSRIYKMMKHKSFVDTYYDSGAALQSNQPVAWQAQSGTDWYHGTIKPLGFRAVIESAATSGIEFTAAYDPKNSNIVSNAFSAADNRTVTATQTDLTRPQWIGLYGEGGYGLQWQFSGDTGVDMTLISATVTADFQPAHGLGVENRK